MRRFSWLAVTLLFACTAASAAPSLNQPAPDFSLTGVDGTTYKLVDFKGRPVVLEWLNRDCPFVRKHYDGKNMQALQRDYTQKKVAWFSVISSAPGKEGHLTTAQAKAWTQEQGAAPTAILLDPDGKVGKLYGAKTTPHMFVIDPKGTLVYAGAIDNVRSTDVADIKGAKNFVRQALDEVLAGKPVTEGATAPYGCSVKYN